MKTVTYVHSVSASRLLTGVTLSKTPVDCVGEGVFLQVGQELLVNLESGEVFWERHQQRTRTENIDGSGSRSLGTYGMP